MTKKSLNGRLSSLSIPKLQVKAAEKTARLAQRHKLYTACIKFSSLMGIMGTIPFAALAQQTISGCVVYEANGSPRLSEPIYSQPTGMTTTCNGYSVQVYSSSSISGPIDRSCRLGTIPDASPALRRDCIVGVKCGLVTTIDFVECSLDDYSAVFLILTAFPAVFAITGYRNRHHPINSKSNKKNKSL